MVDSVKNYGIAGVSTTLELGKQGAKIDASSSSVISLKDKDDGLENVAIANGTDATHGVNKSQLDGISSTKLSKSQTTVAFNSGTTAVGTFAAGSIIHRVVVEKTTGNWTDANSTTEITVGDASDDDRLFSGFEPAGGQFTFSSGHKYVSGTAVNIIVTQGGASAGSATVTIWYNGALS